VLFRSCDSLSDPSRVNVYGGEYAPYFISRFTSGDLAGTTSTFYYTLSTWNSYTEVIMKSMIQVSSSK
jgi:hypothetical protein